MIKLYKMIPDVYTLESRDFLLLCKIGDLNYNSVKYEEDSILNLLNTQYIKNSYLPLLQTKLGFFSSSNINDDELRLILQIFPTLIKLKGSILSIEYLMCAILKLYNISAKYKIEKVLEDILIGNIKLDQYSIMIGINKIIDISPTLKEVMKYILPPGFKLYIYYYIDFSISQYKSFRDKIELIYISDNINSRVRMADNEFLKEYYKGISVEDNLITAVDTVKVATELENNLNTDNFLGTFEDKDSEIPNCVNFKYYSNGKNTYCGYNNSWHVINYKGIYTGIVDNYSGNEYDIFCTINTKLFNYYRYNGSTWDQIEFKGRKLFSGNIDLLQNNEFIIVGNKIKCKVNDSEVELNYLGKFTSTSNISNPKINDYCLLSRTKFYIKLPNNILDITDDFYMLVYYNLAILGKDLLDYGLISSNETGYADINRDLLTY